MLAARAIGLDCGPMSGFDAAGIEAEFSPTAASRPISSATSATAAVQSLFPRSPRLAFDEACRVL